MKGASAESKKNQMLKQVCPEEILNRFQNNTFKVHDMTVWFWSFLPSRIGFGLPVMGFISQVLKPRLVGGLFIDFDMKYWIQNGTD